MRILVKIGGAQLEQPAARHDLVAAVAAAIRAGHELVVVHGGGNQIRHWSQRLDLAEEYCAGLRVTDKDTAALVLMVLAGEVSSWLVKDLGRAGISAIGLSGADGGTFSARRHAPVIDGVTRDLGYVGVIDEVQPRLVETLLAAGHLPVLCTVAPLSSGHTDADDRFYNINADYAVGPLATALGCEQALFLTDVPGVLDAAGNLLLHLQNSDCDRLCHAGIIHGGMVPKVDSARHASAYLPAGRVKIAPARGPNAILEALIEGVGTAFSGNSQSSGARATPSHRSNPNG